ncbi:MAG: sterol desaturase family protein [Rhodospirillaceae bacterium]|nr:sterol desaturase family protein [Rhodospirillaceae bacterium]
MDTTLLASEPVLRFGAFIGVLAILAAWEALAPYQALRQPRAWRWSGNIGLVAVSTVLIRFAAPFAPAGAALLARDQGIGLFNMAGAPAGLAFVASFLALDILVYAQHRVLHTPLLWPLHRVHHSDLELDATTGLRFHPLEIILSLALKIGAVFVLGAPPLAVLAFEVALNAASLFTHANVRMPANLERGLRWMIVTPLMHRGHHSAIRREADTNYGSIFSWWDRLFGSYLAAPAEGYDRMTVGVDAFRDPADSRLDRLLGQPFRNA